MDPGPLARKIYSSPSPSRGAKVHRFHFLGAHMASGYVQPMGTLTRILVKRREGETSLPNGVSGSSRISSAAPDVIRGALDETCAEEAGP